MKKRILGILLSICMVLSVMPAQVFAVETTVTAAEDSDGDGYVEIDTAGKLWWFTQEVNGGNNSLNAELTANIDLAGTCGEGIGNWQPIGNKYSGHFNGQGYTISNLYMSGDDQYIGLFGRVYGATIENVTVIGSVSSTFSYFLDPDNYVYLEGAAGGIVAYMDDGTIRNCHVDMSVVSGGFEIGGICGTMYDGLIEGCTVNGNIICKLLPDQGSGSYIGGIVGCTFGGTIRGCVNRATASAENSVYFGGIAGLGTGDAIENCLNYGTFHAIYDSTYAGGTVAGGIVGSGMTVIRGCGNLGSINISGSGEWTGGIVGVHQTSSSIVENCYNVGSITSSDGKFGVVVGATDTSAIATNNYYLSDTTTDDGGRTAEQFASGQVAYELNGSTTTDESVWKQTLGSDSYPTLTGELVYYITPKMCNGTEIEPIYSNSSSIIYHDDANDDSFCDLCGWIIISEITFPDANFRTYISENIDADKDGLLSSTEISEVWEINVEQSNITDLTGIKYFTKLEYLVAGGNSFATLDLSGLSELCYLDVCGNGSLTSLDITDCTKLEHLDISSCMNLESIDLTTNTELQYLNIEGIWWSSIDLSKNTKLGQLIISNTGFTTLDLSNNPEIYRFEGASLIPIKHCGVGYVNLNEFVDDISKILSVTNGTLEDGWVKLDDGATYLFYDYDTGLEGYPLSVKVHLSISNVEHSYVSNITGKDETGHFTEWCETCRTGNEESVTEHTYEEIVQADFAKTPATCTTGTIYYKSCECGRTIEETFEDTDLNSENHTGTNDKLVPNGVLHHDVVWSCCGAVVTENVDCTASDADGSCLTAETCACGNLLIAAKDSHKLTYTASGNVITETCGRDGCAHTATATLHAPENPVYNGTQKLATVTYSDDWKGDDLMVGYSGTANDGSSYAGIVYPAVKAGTVTASITAQSEDYTVATASVEYTIEKATNEWTQAPAITGWTYGEFGNEPTATPKFGSVGLSSFSYRVKGTVAWTNNHPSDAGIYEMRTRVQASDNWELLETTIEFEIKKAIPTVDTFDFTPPANLVCDGLAKEATVTVKEAIEGVGSVTVKYFKDGVELTGAPTAVGTYTVQIDVAEGANFKPATLTDETWTFTVVEHDPGCHMDANKDMICDGCGMEASVMFDPYKVLIMKGYSSPDWFFVSLYLDSETTEEACENGSEYAIYPDTKTVYAVVTNGDQTETKTVAIDIVYQVEITWTETEFTYVDGEWNPETHEQTGGWEGSCEITLTNTGTMPVDYELTYTSVVEGITGVFSTTENPTAALASGSLDIGDVKTVAFKPEGRPPRDLNDEKIGTLTVKLGGD